MSFKSLSHILEVLENQAQWKEGQEFRHLQKCWPQVVGPAVAKQTRLLSIQRQTLRVATSSAVWSQTLTFERRRILAKLNPLLPRPLVDIRFFTDGWPTHPDSTQSPHSELQPGSLQAHPSSMAEVTDAPETCQIHDPKTVHEAFNRWAEGIQARSQSLPLCPQCQCPTPPGELQRWSICALCAAK